MKTPSSSVPGLAPTPTGRPRRTWWRVIGGLLLGMLAGICLHYLLYRLALPSKPFIYVAF